LKKLSNLSVPLSDARSAGVGEDDAADRAHGVGQAVALDGRADLLGAGRDVEVALGLK
jgi:hypothetical protein